MPLWFCSSLKDLVFKPGGDGLQHNLVWLQGSLSVCSARLQHVLGVTTGTGVTGTLLF